MGRHGISEDRYGVNDIGKWLCVDNDIRRWLWGYMADRPDQDQQHCYHHAPTVKPEAATAVVELLMMGVRMPETC
jgi:hypothetical protein